MNNTNKKSNTPETPHKNNAPTQGRPLALEVITFRPPASVVVSEADYIDCIAPFEAMAAAACGRFELQLGNCGLVFSQHPDSTSLMLICDGQIPLGHARLVWSKYNVAEFRNYSTLFLPHLTGLEIKHTARKIPALIIHLAPEFQTKARSPEINLTLHALVGAGFGLLKFLKQHPDYVPDQYSLKLPTTRLLAGADLNKSRRKASPKTSPSSHSTTRSTK